MYTPILIYIFFCFRVKTSHKITRQTNRRTNGQDLPRKMAAS